MHFISIINNDWITIMRNSRHELSQPRSQGSLLPVPTCWRENLGTRLELSTVRMLYSLKKLSCYPLPPHNSHLSTTATFFSPQGGRCGGVRLYFHSCNFHHRVIYELTMACSPVGLISSMDWALRRSGCDSRSGLKFFFFFRTVVAFENAAYFAFRVQWLLYHLIGVLIWFIISEK